MVCSGSSAHQEEQPRTLCVLDRWYSGEKLLMRLLLVGQPLLHKSTVANGHTQDHQPLFFLWSLTSPRLGSNGVKILGSGGCTVPDFGLSEVHLDICKPGQRLLDLEEDLTNAGGIAKDVAVVEERKEHLPFVQ